MCAKQQLFKVHEKSGSPAPQNFPAWLTLDLEITIQNLFACKKQVFDISPPLFARIWKNLELSLQQAGVEFIASRDLNALLKVSESFTRILLPGIAGPLTGCAHQGIVPVLSDYADVLSLSNQAQQDDRRYSFILRLQTLNRRFFSEDSGFNSVLSRLDSLSMVDLAGVLIEASATENEIAALGRKLAAFCDKPLLVSKNVEKTNQIFSFSLLGLSENVRPNPLKIEFWAYPFAVERDEVLLRIDLGRAQGLPASFPACIGNLPASIKKVELNHSIISIKDQNAQLPARCRGTLLGGGIAETISPHSWDFCELKSLLHHCGNFPVYLCRDGKLIECP
jgi:hypothetical protein